MPAKFVSKISNKISNFYKNYKIKANKNTDVIIGGVKFDSRIYLSLNPDIIDRKNEHALEHFMLHGINEIRPFTLEYSFSSRFYKESYPDLNELSEPELYHHWLMIGANENRFPSAARLLQSLGLDLDDIPKDFSIERYKAPYADLSKMSRYEGFRHFVEYGLREGRALPFAPGKGNDFLRLLSDNYHARGDIAMAALCLDRVLATSPDDALALQSYADMQLRAGNNFVARTLYQKAFDLNPGYFWTSVNNAVASQNLGLHDEAVNLFSVARALEPGLEMPRQRLRQAAATSFHIDVLNATHEALAGQPDKARGIVRNAVKTFNSRLPLFALPAPTPVARSGKPRIAMIAAHLVPVCWEYRVKQKQKQMEAAGYEFRAWPYPEIDDFKDHLHLYDIAIFFRLPADPQVLDAISYADRLGVTTVYEIDDLIFDEKNYPPPYETFSGLVDKFWYAGLTGSATQHMAALEACQYGIASTPSLTDAITPIVKRKKAFLHRNALNGSRNASAQVMSVVLGDRDPNYVTAFYGSGSKSHNENFDALAAPALAAAFERHPNFRLVVTGPLVLGKTLRPYQHRIDHREFISDASEYQRLLASADINLAPLTRSVFNDCKSEIKWLEAAILGVPSLVSWSDMYSRTVTSGVDAFVARDAGEWTEMLETMIVNQPARSEMAHAARAKAIDLYSLEPMSANLDAIISEIAPPSNTTPPWKKKRVLMVNTHFAPQSIGGATRSVEGIVQELVHRYSDDFEIEVFCAQQYGRPGTVERYKACDVNVTAYAPHDRPDLGVGDIDLISGEVFRNYLKKYQPDLIHFHAMQLLSASPLDVAHELSIPFVVTTHDGWWLSSHPFLADAEGRLVMDTGDWGDQARIDRLRKRLNLANAVIAPSRTFASLYRSRGIPNVIAAQNGISPLPDVASAPTSGKIVVGLLGGLGVAKGAVLLMHALRLADFKNLEFVVVDHAVASSSVRSETWGSTQVRIIGRVPQNEIGSLYAQLHVVLAISVCAESFGLVAREALHLGRWVIASDRGAVNEDIVPGENGFIIDVSNPTQLINALRTIDDNPEKYRSQNASAQPLTTIAQQADELVRTYRNVLSIS